MADNNDIEKKDNGKTPKKESPSTKKPPTAAQKKVSPGTSSKNTSTKNTSIEQCSSMKPATLLSVVAIVIAVLALIEGFYLGNKTRENNKTEITSTQTLSKNIRSQKQQLSGLTAQLAQLKTNLEKNTSQIGENEASVQTLNDVKDLNNNRWILVDVNHLLNMAEYHLTLVPTPNTALAILKKTEKQLTSLNDPKTLKLRQAVTNAITQLKALPKIDYAGALMQLNAISQQLSQLPLVSDHTSGKIQKLNSTTNTESGWRKYWHKSLDALEKLVVIRHQSQPIEPLISPKQQMFLIENIQLKLSQASWALLQNNQTVFENSLSTAITWINKYYAPDNTATTSVVTTLSTLKKMNLQPKLPDVSNAIELSSKLLNAKSVDTKATITTGDKS